MKGICEGRQPQAVRAANVKKKKKKKKTQLKIFLAFYGTAGKPIYLK